MHLYEDTLTVRKAFDAGRAQSTRTPTAGEGPRREPGAAHGPPRAAPAEEGAAPRGRARPGQELPRPHPRQARVAADWARRTPVMGERGLHSSQNAATSSQRRTIHAWRSAHAGRTPYAAKNASSAPTSPGW